MPSSTAAAASRQSATAEGQRSREQGSRFLRDAAPEATSTKGGLFRRETSSPGRLGSLSHLEGGVPCAETSSSRCLSSFSPRHSRQQRPPPVCTSRRVAHPR